MGPAGMLYQAALRAELTSRLGVEWGDVSVHGQAEVAGVPDELRHLFSQRRAVAETRVAELTEARQLELGRALSVAERRIVWQQAVLETRDKKTHDGHDIGLHDQWVARAVDAGQPVERWLPGTLDRAVTVASPQVSTILDELEASRSTWTRADVVRAVAVHTPAHGDAITARAWIERTTDEVLAAKGVVRLAAPDTAAPGELRRRDGQSVFDHHDAARFTTTRTLHLEQHILATASAGTSAGRAVADAEVVAETLRFHRRSGDQADVVEALTLSGAAVQCLVGPAGAGKSRTIASAAHAWRNSGVPVQGVAVSAVAARVLYEESRVHSETIAKLLHAGDPIPAGGVLVVDEAGMVSTRDLGRLLELTEAAHGKLVLVGDPNQLGPIQAGGLFALLCEDHAVELRTLHRFTNPWEADSSLRLRAHDGSVLDTYEFHGRIEDTNGHRAVDRAAQEWFSARGVGQSCVITAADNDTVDAICEHIRDQRVLRGDVERDGVWCGGHVVGAGDEIVTLRNDRSLQTDQREWVRNGDRWHVERRHPDNSLTVTSLDGRGTLTLPSSYTSDDVHLAYAVTVHKAQGVTVDRAITVVDTSTSREHLYVGMTRGRDLNQALVITEPADSEWHQPAGVATISWTRCCDGSGCSASGVGVGGGGVVEAGLVA